MGSVQYAGDVDGGHWRRLRSLLGLDLLGMLAVLEEVAAVRSHHCDQGRRHIERRGLDRIGVHGGDGIVSAEALHGIAKPAWFAGVAWRDDADPVMRRADETELLPGAPAGSAVQYVLRTEQCWMR
ncbi:hypothetical protein AB0887_31305 [Streptomyces huasconensis]|uniref:Uncharacterized protein n=1 Tax=Streptomyces huasconensis TaxID=1854574 RepID=A0ABV3M3Z1_9ACTN